MQSKKNLTPAAIGALASGDLRNFIYAATPGGIEAQEKGGQMGQAVMPTLPKGRRDPQHLWETLGFVFRPLDDLFDEAQFPPGWSKQPTEHSMWTDILDEKGRKRGSIFYKAAFYDRSAHASLSRRFSVTQTYDDGPVKIYVSDACGIVVHEIAGLAQPDWKGDRDEAGKRQQAIYAAEAGLTEWLNANYPDWKSPIAYWDV